MKFFDAFVDNARALTGKNASDLDVETVASREFTDAEAAFYGTVMNTFKENPQCEVDFTEWDPTEPAKVPFGLSKASNASKIRPHVAMAACIAERFFQQLKGDVQKAAQTTLDGCKRRVAELQKEFPDAKRIEDFLTRPFTASEKEFFEVNGGYLPGISESSATAREERALSPDPKTRNSKRGDAAAENGTLSPGSKNRRPEHGEAAAENGALSPGSKNSRSEHGEAAAEIGAPSPGTKRRRSERGEAAAAAAAAAAPVVMVVAAAPKKQPAGGRGRGRAGSKGGEQSGEIRRRRGARGPIGREQDPEAPVVTIIKKRKARAPVDQHADDDPAGGVATAHAIPISEVTGRILLSQTELSQIYYKGYMADAPLKPMPRQLEGACLSSMFQLVRVLYSNIKNE